MTTESTEFTNGLNMMCEGGGNQQRSLEVLFPFFFFVFGFLSDYLVDGNVISLDREGLGELRRSIILFGVC